MNDIEPTQTSFSSVEPNLQLYHDASSMKVGEKCWRLYYYSIVRGFGPPGSDNDHLVFGQIFHAATELYDRAKARGADHETALNFAIKYTLIATWNEELQRPWVSDEPTKSRATLIRTIILYLDRYKDSHLETLILSDGKPAVEHSFRLDVEIKAPTGESYFLCGHLDKAVVWNDKICIPDKKTTKFALDDNYFAQFSPDIQISLYTFAGKQIFSADLDGVIIDGAQVLVGGSRFRRRFIERSDEQLEDWYRGFQTYLLELERNIADNYWPMRETSCGWGMNQCAFRPVCSSDPSMREDILNAHYRQRERWNPRLPRGEAEDSISSDKSLGATEPGTKSESTSQDRTLLRSEPLSPTEPNSMREELASPMNQIA